MARIVYDSMWKILSLVKGINEQVRAGSLGCFMSIICLPASGITAA